MEGENAANLDDEALNVFDESSRRICGGVHGGERSVGKARRLPTAMREREREKW